MASPGYLLLDKLNSGQDAFLDCGGDSTCQGKDGGGVTGLVNWGWPAMLGIKIGTDRDYNVSFTKRILPSGSNTSIIHTSTAGMSAPTLHIRNIGWGGSTPAWWITNISAYNGVMHFPVGGAQADLIIMSLGHNIAYTPGGATTLDAAMADIPSLHTLIRSRCPDSGIMWITQNPKGPAGSAAASTGLTKAQWIADWAIGTSTPMPMSPTTQQSTTLTKTWMMDTYQAYGNVHTPALYLPSDATHPNGAGYQAQADQTADELQAGYTPPVPVPPVITTAALSVMTEDELFSQALIVTPSTPAPTSWSMTGTLPTGLSFNTTTGVITGTPTVGYQSYDVTFTVITPNGSNTTGHFTGSVIPAVQPAGPFVGTASPRFRHRLGGFWYPAILKLKVDGEFRQVVLRSTPEDVV